MPGFDIDKSRNTLEGAGEKLKAGEGISYAIIRAGFDSGDTMKKSEVEKAYLEITRKSNKDRITLLKLIKEAEETYKNPLKLGTVIKLEKIIPTLQVPQPRAEDIAPIDQSLVTREPPKNKTRQRIIPERSHPLGKISENIKPNINQLNKEDILTIRTLFDTMTRGDSPEAIMMNTSGNFLMRQPDSRYFLWSIPRENNTRDVYYLDKQGNPVGKLTINKQDKITHVRGYISQHNITYLPKINHN